MARYEFYLFKDVSFRDFDRRLYVLIGILDLFFFFFDVFLSSSAAAAALYADLKTTRGVLSCKGLSGVGVLDVHVLRLLH